MSETSRTVEAQYEAHLGIRDEYGFSRLGIEKNGAWHMDPRRLVFALSRYKFVAKMFSGRNSVLEVGCGDGWPIPIVLQEVSTVHGVDIDPVFIEDASQTVTKRWPYTCAVHDMLEGPVEGSFDGIYCLDVLEHIPAAVEDLFLSNLTASLAEHAPVIIGMPSLESQTYASALSKAGHVNCKSGRDLRRLLGKYFYNVFMFSMNDEVVHTGFDSMAQDLLAVCTELRSKVE